MFLSVRLEPALHLTGLFLGPIARRLWVSWAMGLLFCALFWASETPLRAETFAPPPGTHWVTVASTQDVDTAIGIARLYGPTAHVIRSKSGWLAVSLEPRKGSLQQIAQTITWPPLPNDALLSSGRDYVETIWTAPVERQASAEVKRDKPGLVSFAALEVIVTREPAAQGWTAHVTAQKAGKQVLDVRHSFAEGDPDYASSVMVAEVDGGNDTPEIFIDAYSGGAHCCTKTVILDATTPTEWKMVELGNRDGEGIDLEDVDGDGESELILPDNSFLYTFDCYACSLQPLRINRIDKAAISDVSMDPKYRHRLVQDVRGMEFLAKVQPDRWHSNGFLAAWVASKNRIGEGQEAWSTMVGLFDRNSDFGVDVCDTSQPIETCPDDRRHRLSFPDGLRQHMEKHGYGSIAPGTASAEISSTDPVSLEGARAAFLAIPIERRRDIQLLLASLGYWPAVAGDGFGKNLWQAIKNFQNANGKLPNGVLSGSDYDELLRAASPMLSTWGLSHVTHPVTGTPLWIPRGLAKSTLATNTGMRFGAGSEGAIVNFDYYPSVTLQAMYGIVQEHEDIAAIGISLERRGDQCHQPVHAAPEVDWPGGHHHLQIALRYDHRKPRSAEITAAAKAGSTPPDGAHQGRVVQGHGQDHGLQARRSRLQDLASSSGPKSVAQGHPRCQIRRRHRGHTRAVPERRLITRHPKSRIALRKRCPLTRWRRGHSSLPQHWKIEISCSCGSRRLLP